MIYSIVKTLTSGLSKEIFAAIKTYFPPSMTEKEKNNIAMALQHLEQKKQLQVALADEKAQQQFNERIEALEGTSRDLQTLPIIGGFIIFLRGCQRPIWGYATIYCDFMWFTTWNLNNQQENALTIINVLVLGFLFGERTIKNLEPLFIRLWGKDAPIKKRI